MPQSDNVLLHYLLEILFIIPQSQTMMLLDQVTLASTVPALPLVIYHKNL